MKASPRNILGEMARDAVRARATMERLVKLAPSLNRANADLAAAGARVSVAEAEWVCCGARERRDLQRVQAALEELTEERHGIASEIVDLEIAVQNLSHDFCLGLQSHNLDENSGSVLRRKAEQQLALLKERRELLEICEEAIARLTVLERTYDSDVRRIRGELRTSERVFKRVCEARFDLIEQIALNTRILNELAHHRAC